MSKLLNFVGSTQVRRRKSGYDIAVEQGFEGSEIDWEQSLHGKIFTIDTTNKVAQLNLRKGGSTEFQYIPFAVDIQNYTGTLVLTCSQGTFFYNNGGISYDTEEDEITIQITEDTLLEEYSLKLPYAFASGIVTIDITATLTYELGTDPLIAIASLGVVDKTSEPVELEPVGDIDELPEYINKIAGDVVTGDNLIRGDYIVVKYYKVPSTEPFDSTKVYYIKHGTLFEKVDISAFDPQQTYYLFRPTPYQYNGATPYQYEGWFDEVTNKTVIDTLKTTIDLAKRNDYADYHDCLYAYSAYINNLVVGILTVGQIFANDIESVNYEEDENGFALQGYKLLAQSGLVKSVGSQFKNANIFGVLDLTKTVSGVTRSKAEIIHPALTTTPYVAGASSPADYPSATCWGVQDICRKMTPNEWYNNATGTYLSKTIAGMAYVTNVSAPRYPAEVASYDDAGSFSGEKLIGTYIAKNGTSITVNGYLQQGQGVQSHLFTSLNIRIVKNGSNVSGSVITGRNDSFNYSFTFPVSIGDTIQIYASNFRGTLTEIGKSYNDSGMSQTGLWILAGGSYYRLNVTDTLTNATVLNVTSPSTIAFNSSNNIRYRLCNDFITYCVTYCPDIGITYSASNNSFQYWNGSSMVSDPIVNVIRDSATSITLISANGNSYNLRNGLYYPFNGSFKIEGSEEGIKTKSMYPLVKNTETVGFATRKYAQGNFVTINNNEDNSVYNGNTINCKTINIESLT